jgi:hypothetical protein
MAKNKKGMSGEAPPSPLKEPSKTLEKDGSNSIIAYGSKIDKELQRLRSEIKVLKGEEKCLTDAGCLLAKIHFKTDRPNVMYMLEPVDAEGKRKYIHVGVKPKKQDEAYKKVNRYENRQKLRRKIHQLNELEKECNFKLSSMLDNLKFEIDEKISEALN